MAALLVVILRRWWSYSSRSAAGGVTRLRRTHIRRRAPGEKIFPRRREDVHDLGVFGEKTFVLGAAGNDCDIARVHRTLLVADAEIHLALEHPNDLLVRMLMRARMRARLDFPPHDHSMLAGKNAALDFVIDALPRQLLERAEPRHRGHDCFPSVALPRNIIAALDGRGGLSNCAASIAHVGLRGEPRSSNGD